MFLFLLLIIALTVALLLSFMRNRRARTGNNLLGDGAGGGTIDLKAIQPPLPTCPSVLPYELAADEPDTCEAKAPHRVAYGTGSGYRPDSTYAEATDFDDAGLLSGGGNAPATPIAQPPVPTQLVSKTSSNESYNKSGTL